MKLLSHIRRFGLPTLRELAGETLLKAVEGCSPSEQESQLAEILSLRHANGILEIREIRDSLIDSLNENEAKNLSELAGIPIQNTHIERCLDLHKHFQTYNNAKSKQLVSFFELPDPYVYHPTRDERTESELINITLGEQVQLRKYLHGYQKIIKDDINSRLNHDSARFMVQMPTGAGKTYTALEVIIDVMRTLRDGRFVVWIVDSNELAEQALEAFKFLWKLKGDRPITISRLFNKFCPDFTGLHKGGVVFASFDKLNSILTNNDHPKRVSVDYLQRRTYLLCVDEAHASIAHTYRSCIESFSDTSCCRIVGLTATPGRADSSETRELSDVFFSNLLGLKDDQNNPIDDPVHFLQINDYLAEISYELLESGITINDADEKVVCRKLAANSKRNSDILKQIQLANDLGQSTLVFACTLDHVFALNLMCRKNLIESKVIIGSTPQPRRLEILQDFRDKNFFILINLDILSTGIDLPKVDKLILTRPITSPVLYSQILGRALRGTKNGGNKRNVVVNIKDNLIQFPAASLLYSHFWEDWIKR